MIAMSEPQSGFDNKPIKEKSHTMKGVSPYVHFNGNCRDAMSFYQKYLAGDLHLQPYPDTTGKPPSDPKAPLMHSQLTVAGAPMLMASDSSPEGPVRRGNNFSVSVEYESLNEIERFFAAIGEKWKFRLPAGRHALGRPPWHAYRSVRDSVDFNCTANR